MLRKKRFAPLSKVVSWKNKMYKEGNIYTYKATRFRWQLIRILKNTDNTVHVRLYSELYWRQPNINSFKKSNWEIGHLPLDEEALNSWGLILIGSLPVEEDELEGYYIWKEDEDAGVFS